LLIYGYARAMHSSVPDVPDSILQLIHSYYTVHVWCIPHAMAMDIFEVNVKTGKLKSFEVQCPYGGMRFVLWLKKSYNIQYRGRWRYNNSASVFGGLAPSTAKPTGYCYEDIYQLRLQCLHRCDKPLVLIFSHAVNAGTKQHKALSFAANSKEDHILAQWTTADLRRFIVDEQPLRITYDLELQCLQSLGKSIKPQPVPVPRKKRKKMDDEEEEKVQLQQQPTLDAPPQKKRKLKSSNKEANNSTKTVSQNKANQAKNALV